MFLFDERLRSATNAADYFLPFQEIVLARPAARPNINAMDRAIDAIDGTRNAFLGGTRAAQAAFSGF